MMSWVNFLKLAVCLLVPQLVGIISSVSVENGMSLMQDKIDKPTLQPPGVTFAVVWPILYFCMGLASYFVVISKDTVQKNQALSLYILQLIFNFLWTIFYAGLNNIAAALVDVIALTILVAWMWYEFRLIDKYAGYLIVPYLLWSCFATYLTIHLFVLNGSKVSV